MSADRYAKISFLAAGHVIQDILITDPNISAEKLNDMLNSGEAITTIHEGKEVCVTSGDWETIGEVTYVEPEMEYSEFQLEDEYELPTPKPEKFNITELSMAFAIGEVIDTEISKADTIKILVAAGNNVPLETENNITIQPQYHGKSGNELLNEIRSYQQGYMSLAKAAYQAAKEGKVLV
jgi:hypothetical protein